jgi:hypothetical protein
MRLRRGRSKQRYNTDLCESFEPLRQWVFALCRRLGGYVLPTERPLKRQNWYLLLCCAGTIIDYVKGEGSGAEFQQMERPQKP